MRPVLALVLLASATNAFYLPGVAPKEYNDGEKVDLKVNSLTSIKTHLPYDYYKLPFCTPTTITDAAENLGEILTGNEIENSPYDLRMGETEYCKVLCRQKYTAEESKAFVEKITGEYVVNWIVDNLPAATDVSLDNGALLPVYEHGWPLGGSIKTEPPSHFLNNHARITIKYHYPESSGDWEGRRIVGVEVEPFSVRHKFEGEWAEGQPAPKLLTCQAPSDLKHEYGGYEQLIGESKAGETVVWTYDAIWEPSDIRWASRWDVYLSMNSRYDDDVHWFSIVNSVLICLFLTGMVAMIMCRTLRKDFARYNRIPTEEEKEEEREETGWKLVHGDVFRAPRNPMLFCVSVGTGYQVFAMSFVTIGFAALGFLSPANRGALMIAFLLLFVLLGVAAGYQSARLYKNFRGKKWQRTTLLTALLFPGVVFFIFFVLNLVVWAEGSSSAVPFGSLCAVLALWFGISVPLTFLGAFFGFKKDADAMPVATQEIPRQVPEQPWYMACPLVVLVGGILPFGAVFVELFFILSALWLDQYYYVFGFLAIVFVILAVTCAEITVVLCYFQLCGEDYHWWWRSFLTSGSSAVYLFLYSAFYWSTKLDMTHFTSAMLYFGYMFIISLLFFLCTGTMGFLATYWFVRKIYGSIKVD